MKFPAFVLAVNQISSNGVTTKLPLCARSWHFPSSDPRNVQTREARMDSDSDVGESVAHQESCSNEIKRQISNSSDTSDADGCQRKTRRPKVRRRPTRYVRLPSYKHRYEEDTSDDDGLFKFDSIKTISPCSKIVSAAEDGFASSNESESGSADLPSPYVPYINEATNDWGSPSSQETENELLYTLSVDSDCSGRTEINAAFVNEEAEDQTRAYLLSNSSGSSGEELDSCDDSNGNDSSSDESDKDSFLPDDGSDRANVFSKSIYEGSNLSVGASCILITQFSRKYKLPRKAQNDLLTLLKLHCPEGVEIALPQTYKELLKKTMPSLANIAKVRVCSICTKNIEGDATECEDGHPAGRPTKEDSYFIELPLEPQLKMIIEGNLLIIMLYEVDRT